ncbi:hypothetical protein ACFT2C_12075 [Promicromonospora sp. NPDC057138]|uniref:hypothetical protein n=1 Tax=Promicromonospora sp. NPDC057138 TaxID=3346031 RepID=UPI0036372B9B
MLAAQAIPASDITPAGIMHFGVTLQEASTARDKHERKLAGSLIWQVLADAGRFPEDTPVTMRLATVGGRKTATELVDTSSSVVRVFQVVLRELRRCSRGDRYGPLDPAQPAPCA